MVSNIAAPTMTVIRGDSNNFSIKFNNKYVNKIGVDVKTPIDITGWSIRFTVRKNVPTTSIDDDTDAIISKVADIPDGTLGIAIFHISEEDNNIDEDNYWYDIQFVSGKGTANETTRSVRKGKYVIVNDITRTVG